MEYRSTDIGKSVDRFVLYCSILFTGWDTVIIFTVSVDRFGISVDRFSCSFAWNFKMIYFKKEFDFRDFG